MNKPSARILAISGRHNKMHDKPQPKANTVNQSHPYLPALEPTSVCNTNETTTTIPTWQHQIRLAPGVIYPRAPRFVHPTRGRDVGRRDV